MTVHWVVMTGGVEGALSLSVNSSSTFVSSVSLSLRPTVSAPPLIPTPSLHTPLPICSHQHWKAEVGAVCERASERPPTLRLVPACPLSCAALSVTFAPLSLVFLFFSFFPLPLLSSRPSSLFSGPLLSATALQLSCCLLTAGIPPLTISTCRLIEITGFNDRQNKTGEWVYPEKRKMKVKVKKTSASRLQVMCVAESESFFS